MLNILSHIILCSQVREEPVQSQCLVEDSTPLATPFLAGLRVSGGGGRQQTQ